MCSVEGSKVIGPSFVPGDSFAKKRFSPLSWPRPLEMNRKEYQVCKLWRGARETKGFLCLSFSFFPFLILCFWGNERENRVQICPAPFYPPPIWAILSRNKIPSFPFLRPRLLLFPPTSAKTQPKGLFLKQSVLLLDLPRHPDPCWRCPRF